MSVVIEGNESSLKFNFKEISKRYCLDMFEISPDFAKHRVKFRTIFRLVKRIFERRFVECCEILFVLNKIEAKFRSFPVTLELT